MPSSQERKSGRKLKFQAQKFFLSKVHDFHFHSILSILQYSNLTIARPALIFKAYLYLFNFFTSIWTALKKVSFLSLT
jgi:hypothetical protein